jgi:hypothetical protein
VPVCERLAIEVDAGHVERFSLGSVYHQVETLDATRWWQEDPESAFDLVVIGDCLQHLPKSAGLDLLNALVYRCAWLVVLVPEFIIQGAVDGADSSVHRSVWSERDMHWHDLWAWDNARAITMFVLRGYQPSALNIDELVHRVNDAALPLKDYDGQGVVRPCRLRLVEHPREVGYRAR